MKINEQCLPCLISQAVRTANLVKADNREELYREIFRRMGQLDFSKTNPQIAGENYRLLKRHIGCDDPYRETKTYYNRYFLEHMDLFEHRMHTTEEIVKYAIAANIIDFNPIHENVDEDIRTFFADMENIPLTINDVEPLLEDVQKANSILYLGDNCGEICFDKLLVRRIKMMRPKCRIYFGVRGEAVVNDNTKEDACFVGMDRYAEIISNGDDSLGTVLSRTSEEFREIYEKADVVIAKGQANYESLSEENKNIYFLLVVKCQVMAQYLGVKEKSFVCRKQLSR